MKMIKGKFKKQKKETIQDLKTKAFWTLKAIFAVSATIFGVTLFILNLVWNLTKGFIQAAWNLFKQLINEIGGSISHIIQFLFTWNRFLLPCIGLSLGAFIWANVFFINNMGKNGLVEIVKHTKKNIAALVSIELLIGVLCSLPIILWAVAGGI